MWNEVFKGVDKLDALINEITGITGDLMSNVVGIVFHAITPPRSSIIKPIIIGRFDSLIISYKMENATFAKECGKLYVPKQNNYTDYLTDVSIYLPYIGICPISANIVMGKTLKLTYIVDVSSGACCAEIFVDNSLKYSFNGNEGCQVPFSMSNGEEYISSILNFTMAVAGGAVAGGAKGAGFALASGATIEVPDVSNSSGNTSGSVSQIMPQTPFVICVRTKKADVGDDFAKNIGQLYCATAKLGELSGLTICPNPRIDAINADEPPMMDGEYDMLMSALREGVIL